MGRINHFARQIQSVSIVHAGDESSIANLLYVVVIVQAPCAIRRRTRHTALAVSSLRMKNSWSGSRGRRTLRPFSHRREYRELPSKSEHGRYGCTRKEAARMDGQRRGHGAGDCPSPVRTAPPVTDRGLSGAEYRRAQVGLPIPCSALALTKESPYVKQARLAARADDEVTSEGSRATRPTNDPMRQSTVCTHRVKAAARSSRPSRPYACGR